VFNFFIITFWFELNDKLHIKHFSNFRYADCETAIAKIVKDLKKKNINKKIKAAKCNDPIIWFKKYRLNKWDQVKDKE